jgi:hypothetical protein
MKSFAPQKRFVLRSSRFIVLPSMTYGMSFAPYLSIPLTRVRFAYKPSAKNLYTTLDSNLLYANLRVMAEWPFGQGEL